MVGLAEMQTYKSIIAIKESRKKILMAVPLSPPPLELNDSRNFSTNKNGIAIKIFFAASLTEYNRHQIKSYQTTYVSKKPTL